LNRAVDERKEFDISTKKRNAELEYLPRHVNAARRTWRLDSEWTWDLDAALVCLVGRGHKGADWTSGDTSRRIRWMKAQAEISPQGVKQCTTD